MVRYSLLPIYSNKPFIPEVSWSLFWLQWPRDKDLRDNLFISHGRCHDDVSKDTKEIIIRGEKEEREISIRVEKEVGGEYS